MLAPLAAARADARDLHDARRARARCRRRRLAALAARAARRGTTRVEVDSAIRPRPWSARGALGAPRRRGRIHLSHRSPAWYSSLIPGRDSPTVTAWSVSSFSCSACVALSTGSPRRRPRAPRRISPAARCLRCHSADDEATVDEPIDGKTERSTRCSDGNAGRPVQIDCDDMQFFADHVEIFRDAGPGRRHAATCCSCPSGNRISAERMEFNTKTQHRHVLRRHGHAPSLRRHGRSEPVRHAGAGCVLLRRGAAQARPEEVQDRRRRLHDLRAADAAMGGGVRVDHDDARRLRAPEERGASGSRACR